MLAIAIALAFLLPTAVLPVTSTGPARATQGELLSASNLASARASIAGATGSAPSGASSPDSAAAGAIGEYRWTNASYAVGTIAPNHRSNPDMTWDASDGYILLFGGVSSQGIAETDTWTYLNGTWTNISSSVIGHPPPMARASMVFDPSTDSVILYGGFEVGVAYENYTWSYHARTWTNLTATAGPAPPTSAYTSVAADPSDGELVAVVEYYIDQTWTFKSGHWTNITTSAPPPIQASVVYLPFGLSSDAADGGVLLLSEFITSTGYHGETYLFKAGAWQNLTAEAPNAPLYPYGIVPWWVAPLFYLPGASAVVFYETLVMNESGDLFDFPETWVFSADHWTNISGPAGGGPYPWISGGMSGAVDPLDSAVVAFGGFAQVGSTYLWIPTWVLSAPPIVAVTATPSSTDVGIAVHLRGNVSFGLEPNNASWSLGDGTTATGATATHTYTEAGLYTANLTVTDLVNQASTGAAALVVHPRPAPSISFGPAQPVAGGNVTFVATVAGGTPPFTFGWNLGDGTTRSGSVVAHAYASSGSYSVNLTVTDSVGAVANVTATVTVASAPSSSSGSTISLTSGVGLALLLGIVVLAVIAAVLAVLWLRKGRTGPPPPTAQPPPGAGSPGVPPPGTGGS